MQYKCNNCRRQFGFDDIIEFCPYCGKMLDGSQTDSIVGASNAVLAKAIDSIWGDSARVKREFSNNFSSCIYLVNECVEYSIRNKIPQQNFSKYQKNYSIIKQSNNRKTLINRINSFLESLENVINNFNDSIAEDISNGLDNAVHTANDTVGALYDFVGLKHDCLNADSFPGGYYSVEIPYSVEQLRDLYQLVLAAYAKYKRCVEDNNMFAAFASTSNYGVLENYWRRWEGLSHSINDEEETPQYDMVMEYMNTHNAEKYLGMLDEDFVPHVDAFWYGLEMLCEFIDHHIVVTCNTSGLIIDHDEQLKLMGIINSKTFEISETSLNNLANFKEQLEARCEELNNQVPDASSTN